VCGGDNSSCDIFSEIVQIPADQDGGYQFIFEIPFGSRSVSISKKTDTNYLALKNPDNGFTFLYYLIFVFSSKLSLILLQKNII
jgi:hypothetical protein